MGAIAALHIAEVHQAPTKRRRPKRSGGGNGADFAAFAHRIYQDERANQESRTLLLAIAYTMTMAELDEETGFWTAVSKALGSSHTSRGALKELLRADIPCYEAPGYRYGTDPMDRLCIGPRMRPAPGGDDDIRNTMNICGARAGERAIERMPDTGWHKNHWFCHRHSDHLARVKAQVKEQNERAPKPIPNRGGLLPCYFDTDWLAVYRWASSQAWQPPVYGICADDWPIPGRDTERIRMLNTTPRFRIIFGGADLTDLTQQGDEPS